MVLKAIRSSGSCGNLKNQELELEELGDGRGWSRLFLQWGAAQLGRGLRQSIPTGPYLAQNLEGTEPADGASERGQEGRDKHS